MISHIFSVPTDVLETVMGTGAELTSICGLHLAPKMYASPDTTPCHNCVEVQLEDTARLGRQYDALIKKHNDLVNDFNDLLTEYERITQ